MHDYVLDFTHVALGVQTPEFKDKEMWPSTFVHVVHHLQS